MNLHLPTNATKKEVFQIAEDFMRQNGFTIINKDETRPWGGFLVIDESQSAKFIEYFFSDVPEADKQSEGKISPKILIVEQGKRLSWQYHHRRAELWKVIAGEAGVITSATDEQKDIQKIEKGSVITLQQGERHRLIGLNQWGIVAEIWKHTDVNAPSDEEDIVRVQDDFGR